MESSREYFPKCFYKYQAVGKNKDQLNIKIKTNAPYKNWIN